MSSRKALELMMSIGGALSSSFTQATNEASAAMEKLAHPKQVTNAQKKIAREQAMALRSLQGQAGDTKAAWGRVGSAIAGPVKQIAAVTAVAGAAIYALGAKTATTVNEMATSAARMGLTTQAYQRLAFAAGQSNVSQQELSYGLRQLTQRMTAASNGCAKATLAFERAGVSIKDYNGNLKSADQLLVEMSAMFAKMPEGIYKADLAMALFGNRGVALVPLLEQGSEALLEQKRRAEELGLVLGDEYVKKAGSFTNAMGYARGAIQGLTLAVGSQLWEPLTRVTRAFADFVSQNRELIATRVGEAVQRFQEILPTLLERLRAIGGQIRELVSRINDIAQRMGGWERVIRLIVKGWLAFKGLKIAVALGGAIAQTLKFGSALLKGGAATKAFFLNMSPAIKAIASFGTSIKAGITKVSTLVKTIGGKKTLMAGLTKVFKVALIPFVKFIAIGAAIAAVVMTVVRNFQALKQHAIDTFSGIMGVGEGVGINFAEVFEKIRTVVTTVFKIIEPIIVQVLKNFITNIGTLVAVVVTAFDLIRTVAQVVAAVFSGDFGKAAELIQGFVGRLGERFSAVFRNIKNMVVNTANTILGIFGTNLEAVGQFFVNVFEGIQSGISSVVSFFASGFTNIGNAVSVVASAIGGFFVAVFNGIQGGINNVVGFFASGFANIKNAVTAVANAISAAFRAVFDFITGGISNILGSVGNIGNAVTGALSRIPGVGRLFNRGGDVPAYADGGWVTKPTMGLIGEAGPEVIIPVNKPNRAMELIGQALSKMNMPAYGSAPSLAEGLASSITNNNTTNNSKTGGASYSFSPVITITGVAGSEADTKSYIDQAMRAIKGEFDKWAREREYQAARVAMG